MARWATRAYATGTVLMNIDELVNKIHCMDALELLARLPDNCINCIITSPPYFGLRDYGVSGQIGLERTPAEYVQALVTLFREARRVLREDGVMWLNLGDSFTGSGKGPAGVSSQLGGVVNNAQALNQRTDVDGLASKNLLLIPARVAIALQDDGWICRMDVIWHKPNPMPESVTDRPTKAHEYVFMFVKSGKYWYDAEAIKEPVKEHSIKRQARAVSDTHKNHNGAPGQTPHSMFSPRPNTNK